MAYSDTNSPVKHFFDRSSMVLEYRSDYRSFSVYCHPCWYHLHLMGESDRAEAGIEPEPTMYDGS